MEPHRTVGAVTGRTFIPITTSTHDYQTAFARSHNCETQEQADDPSERRRLARNTSVRGRISRGLRPARRQVRQSKGWRRNRLRTASGFTIVAIGLDTAARGVKLDEDRPDL